MPKKEAKKTSKQVDNFKSPKSVRTRSGKVPAKKKPEPTTPTRDRKGKAPGKGKGKENKEEEPKRVLRKRPLKPKTPEKSEDDEDEEEEDKEIAAAPKPKKRRIIIPDEDSEGGEDSEDDYVPDDSDEASETDGAEGCTESETATETETEEDTPQKKRARTSVKPRNGTASRFGTGRGKKLSKEESSALNKAGSASGGNSWPHLSLGFLQPDKLRDAKGRRPTDEDYDPGTLLVPKDYLDEQTPMMRQWWVLKSQRFDCVLFFKLGSWYVLYHMDAVTAADELGISYMRGDCAFASFPEMACGRFAEMLVEKGYKVARIEQTERPEMMQERVKNTAKSTKFDKVVRREVCQVSTRGTRVITAQDSEMINPHCNYLLSIFEKTDSAKKGTLFGVCFIDTTIGKFHLGQFEDDIAYTSLLTLLSHYQPVHVVYERENLSPGSLKIINTLLPSARKDALIEDTQFWSASRTLKELHEGDYFKDESGGNFQWPEGLKPYLNPSDFLGLSPVEEKELAVKALGGCVYLLKDFVLDQQILSQKHFQTYIPPDASFADKRADGPPVTNMVLDAITINNLRILGDDMSLLKTLDNCCTPFGKRLLKEWVCRPSCRKDVILSRQMAINELMDHPDVLQQVRKILSHLPDLERLLSKIHTHGSVQKMKNHPDGRAFMSEAQTYTKRKIVDFTTALEGFEKVLKIVEKFGMCETQLLKEITQKEPDGEFPELREMLDYFESAFDHEEASKDKSIVPKKGIDAEYDSILLEFKEIMEDGNKYLKEQQAFFGVKVTFTGNGKRSFQLEVPVTHTSKAGKSYEFQGQRKGFKRFYTDECREFLARQIKAEEQKEKVLNDLNRRIFAKFSEKFDLWSSAVDKIATLDVLVSFADYAKRKGMCVPEIVDDEAQEGYTMIRNGKHPTILSENFVPNDTNIPSEGHASVVIVTGPNMGGKSTLMRQVGLITVMAQIGCHVPASECKLSLVDRIFTRIGASDDILTGRSTFLIEMSETATILRHATKKSLVLLDELGRGTSTYDGTAIAAAVVDALTKLKCRTLFSTHYHSLVEDFKKNQEVSLAHMSCQVETENEEDISEETVTFLYKLTPGACPKSYGFNAARLAGIPISITKRAREVADQFEKETNQRNFFASLCRASGGELKEIISKMKASGKGKEKENEEEEPERVLRKRPLKAKTPEKSEDDEDEEEENKEITDVPKSKRRRIIIPDEDSERGEDSENDYMPDDSDEPSETNGAEGCTESGVITESETEEESPQKKRAKTSVKPRNGTASRFGKGRRKESSKEESSVVKEAVSVARAAIGGVSWPHLSLDFLQPDKLRDAKGCRPTDKDYDPSTVLVPKDYLDKQTPMMRQWWILKSQRFDCVLFFKLATWYVFYHMDAVTAADELGISYLRAKCAFIRIPEMAYGRYAEMLVEKGYKVARIEQTENPEMMQERVKNTVKSTKFDKVVRREVCRVSTRGTRVITAQDPEMINPHCNYLLSIFETTDSAKKTPLFGVCFIDTTIGKFHLGQFEDDIAYTSLLTLLSHYQPVHVVFERENLSPGSLKIINTLLPSARKDAFIKDTQFWSASRTLKELHEGDYFKDESGGNFQWPEGLKPYLNPSDSLGLSPVEEKELAVKALGGCVYLLKDFVLDQQILSQKHFQTYIPPDASFADKRADGPPVTNMVLDAITINNLRILGNDMSLLKTLDNCCTAFGKRLLKEWVCRPSCCKDIILSRQMAINELMDHPAVLQQVRRILSHLPDLERLLSKIHTHGSVQMMKNHPDGRAFMSETQTYFKRKIMDFTTALEGFEKVLKIVEKFGMCKTQLLKKITQKEPDGEFPELREMLDYFESALDHEETSKEESIVPKLGIDAEYDSILFDFEKITKDGDKYLKEQQAFFGVKVTFTGNGKMSFQLEVPVTHTSKAGKSYEFQGQRKGFKRFYTDECREFLARQIKAEEQKEKVLNDLNRRIFAKFSEKFDLWNSAVYKIAMLDVLVSFADYAKRKGMCVPEIVDDEAEEGYTMIRNGKHPTILSENFVPNDTNIPSEGHASVVIVTGPNMGGKSTLMRQVGLITVMAQIGCHVPASECKLSLVDRIFTRIGASDDILTGRSTFLIEMSETATILRHATKKSLVLLDELGRGTSTYDGTAIAAAVVDALTKLKCRTLFSTHYHSLVEDFKKNQEVSLAHMSCQVETENEEDISEETVTFLYKLTAGACPKSYGFNAARLAGIPISITKRAREVADQFEKETNQRNFFASLCRASGGEIKKIISKMKSTVLV